MIQHKSVAEVGDVYVYNTDKFKSESFSLYFSTPSEKEKAIEKSLLLSVLKRGTEKYPSQKLLNKRLDDLYASILSLKNMRLHSAHLFGLGADVINSDYTDDGEDLLGHVAEIMIQIMFFPLTDPDGLLLDEYVKSEKKNYIDTVLSQINDPRAYAALRCREETLGDLSGSYKLSETVEKAEAISTEYLSEFYMKNVRTSKLVAFYIGTKSIDEIEDMLKNKIPHRDIAADDARPVCFSRLADRKKEKYVTEVRDASQARLSMGINANANWFDSDTYAVMICNEILGASGISKLMMNVREKLSLCYECSSVYDMKQGVIYVNSGIDSENADMAKKAILDQIEEIKQGVISEDELIAAKKSIINSYRSVFDSPAAIERVLLGRIICSLDCDMDNVIRTVDSVDKEAVVKAANKLSLDTVYFLDGRYDGEEREVYE